MVDVDRIRKLAIISLFHDNDLLERFVLKGGNALNLVYGFNNRASTDIDVSMENDFSKEELVDVIEKLQESFEDVFNGDGLKVFDFDLYPTPERVRPEYEKFWGGYTLEFKCIEKEKFNVDDIQRTRVQSIVVGKKQQKKFTIDISKYEYCAPKRQEELEGYIIYVYSPVMVVYEKLRAICQQMDEYGSFVKTNRKPRAKDFFDIYTIVEHWKTPVDLYTDENIKMLKEIFAVKKVPLSFLSNLESYREYHRDNFNAVIDTVSGLRLESYDYYVDYVIRLLEPLEHLWLDEVEGNSVG